MAKGTVWQPLKECFAGLIRLRSRGKGLLLLHHYDFVLLADNCPKAIMGY